MPETKRPAAGTILPPAFFFAIPRPVYFFFRYASGFFLTVSRQPSQQT